MLLTEANNLDFIMEHGRLMMAFKLKPIILERELNNEDEMGYMSEAYDALGLVEEMAYLVGKGELKFAFDEFLEIYPEYRSVAKNSFNDGEASIWAENEHKYG